MQEFAKFVFEHSILTICAALVIVLILFIELIRVRRSGFYVNSNTMVDLINHKNAVIIDVRPKEAYKQGHILNAMNMPSIDLRKNLGKLEKYKSQPIVFVCQNGAESRQIATILYQKNYDSYSLIGGIPSWLKADLPTVKE